MGADDEPVDLSTRMRGVVFVVVAMILVVYAWFHRPLDMRTFGEATMAEMNGDVVLKTPFFYGSFAAAAGLLFVGGRTLLRRSRG